MSEIILNRKDFALKSIYFAADLLHPASQSSYVSEEEPSPALEFIDKVAAAR